MLGKENTGEQVADNQSRLIRMQEADILPSIANPRKVYLNCKMD